MTRIHSHPFRTPLLMVATAALLLVAMSGVAQAQAAASPRAAKLFLEHRHDQVNRTLRRTANAQRDRQLGRLLDDLLDYETLAQRSLGDHWAQHSEADRGEFVSLLEQLIERSYKANLERTLSYEVSYESAARRGEVILVETVARSRENRRAPAVSIDYELAAKGNEWKVVNVITDGQSLVQTYRNQFHRILEQDGWDGLLGRMRERLSASGA